MKKILTPLLFVLTLVPVSAWAVSAARPAGNGGVVLRASVPMGDIVNTGDRVSFEYQTREDAAVLVFSIDSRGYVHLLYPQGGPEMSRANTRYVFPESGRELVVDTPDGVEFAFALAVADPSAIDAAELDHLRGTDMAGAEPYRISGDPFIAANMIAAELVRGVSHQEVYFGYTTFNVNRRVEYPCYLCGACDGMAGDNACSAYRVVQNFDRAQPLTYPLRRGYDMVEQVAYDDGGGAVVQNPDGSDVNVNFYPYGSEVRYVDPYTYAYPYGYGWWDPYYGYWPGYYPYCGSGWSIGIGIGWGWGWAGWGGYYCSGWYAPPCYGDYYPCYPSGGGGYGSYPEKFKTRYKSGDVQAGSLSAQRMRAAQRDGDLRIAQKDIQRSINQANYSAISSRSKYAASATMMAGRNRANVNTRVYGANRGASGIKGTAGRTGSRPSGINRPAPTTRGGTSGRVKSGAASRPKSSGTVRGGTSRSRGSSGAARGSAPRASSGKSRGSGGHAPAMRGGSSPRPSGGSFKGSRSGKR